MAAKSAAELQPLDFSSVKDTIRGDLQSDIFDVLVFLVQSANEDNQNKIIHDAVEKLTKLYLGARPSDRLNGRFNSDLEADSDLEAYDVELFFWTLWGLLLDIVRMMPYNHPKQELLVKFLMTLHGKKVGTTTIWNVRIHVYMFIIFWILPTIFKFTMRLIQILF